MQTVTKTVPLADAMAEAEVENVINRKGAQYDRLAAAAQAACDGGDVAALKAVLDDCNTDIRLQGEVHALFMRGA